MIAWDEDLVMDLFEKRDVDLIFGITLNRTRHYDGWFWLHDKRGKYSVSRAYDSLSQPVDGGSSV